MYGGLGAQHAAIGREGLVVQFDGVGVQAVLNANSLLTRLEIGQDLASEARGDISGERNTPTQQAQHVGAAKFGHGMLQQARVQLA
jgi:hypothetical protein